MPRQGPGAGFCSMPAASNGSASFSTISCQLAPRAGPLPIRASEMRVAPNKSKKPKPRSARFSPERLQTKGAMMAYREFVSLVHKSTKRDYLPRVMQRAKAEVAEMAVKFDYDYWDGSRETGYGGYNYDGLLRKVADGVGAADGIKAGMGALMGGLGK